MRYSSFSSAKESHQHSLQILNLFREYDDFMESIGTVLDLRPDPKFLDTNWWATQTVRDEPQTPLNIKCTAVSSTIPSHRKKNIDTVDHDIQTWSKSKQRYDLLWCHDALQYIEHPYTALKNWKSIAEKDGMLVISVPQTTNVEYNQLEFNLKPGHLYHYTVTSLMYMLAVTGWDCANGFFRKQSNDTWIHAIVYNSDIDPVQPGTSWYELVEKGLLPECANKSILNYGYVKQTDLILPWLDKSLSWMAQQ